MIGERAYLLSYCMPLAIVMSLTFPLLGQENPKKLPVPDEAAQQESMKLIGEVYESEYEEANTREKRIALAEKLLRDGIATDDDPMSRFVLLRVARDIAADVGDLETAFLAVSELNKIYDIDSPTMKKATLEMAAKAASSEEDQQQIVVQLQQLIDEAVVSDRYDLATSLSKVALASARKARDKELLKRLIGRRKEIEKTEKAYIEIKAAKVVLDENPADPHANLAVGRFHCLAKGDWDTCKRRMNTVALGRAKSVALEVGN